MKEKPEELNNQAIILANKGNFSDAISCFKRAIFLESRNALLWFNLGATYRDMGELSKAHDSFFKAYEIDSNNEEYLETLATCCLQQKHYNETEQYCMIGLDLNDSNAHFWNLLGVIRFQNDEFKEASEFFEKAVLISPYYEDALINLRDTYSELANKFGVDECQRKLNELKK